MHAGDVGFAYRGVKSVGYVLNSKSPSRQLVLIYCVLSVGFSFRSVASVTSLTVSSMLISGIVFQTLLGFFVIFVI